MKRSKAFFVATIKNNRKRMLATFEQAKKHTRQLLENNSQMRRSISSLRGDDVLKKIRGFLEALLSKVKKLYADGIIRLGAFFPKDIEISSFIRKIPENTGRFSSETYSKFVVRGEYTKRSLIVLFAVAFSLGIAIKAIAVQGVTIGFEDYTLAPHETLYDINLLQQEIIDRGDVLSRNSLLEGGVCQDAE